MHTAGAVGRFGEEVACRHLERDGLRVLARNWRCAGGEIDLVARDGATLVFCEVKTRRGSRFGPPAEAVTPAKAARLRRLAGRFLADRRCRCAAVRFDVVAVLAPPRGSIVVEHLRGVF